MLWSHSGSTIFGISGDEQLHAKTKAVINVVIGLVDPGIVFPALPLGPNAMVPCDNHGRPQVA